MSQEPTGQDIAKQLKALMDYVQDCERRVSRGEIMDLQGLDRNVIVLCDGIAQLPADEARALEGQMSSMIEGLERLAGCIKLQQDQFDGGSA